MTATDVTQDAAAARAPGRPPGDAPPPIIHVSGLRKSFGPVGAVRGVSFDVQPGEVFAFLGPNGAGKSTTIKMLCTLTQPTGGHASVAGRDTVTQPRAVRHRIGLVFQDQTLDEQLTAEENLRFHAVLYGVPRREIAERISRVLELVELSERRRSLVSTFSGGMARRLEIARALLHAPDVLFLDEPTVGLDPQTRARMWTDVLRLREQQQLTVFLTTHYMDEAEYADRIAIIDGGVIVACDTPGALKAAVGRDIVELTTADDAGVAETLRAVGYEVLRSAQGLAVTVPDGERAVAGLVLQAGTEIRHVRIHQPTLDDVFLHFTGRAIRDEQAEPNATARKYFAARRR